MVPGRFGFPKLTGQQLLAAESPPSAMDVDYTFDLSGENACTSRSRRGLLDGGQPDSGVRVTTPRWLSQAYPPEGASAAEGIRNQLGRPELDLLTILVASRHRTAGTLLTPRDPAPSTFA